MITAWPKTYTDRRPRLVLSAGAQEEGPLVLIIGVIGGQNGIDGEVLRMAREVGRLIAERGAHLICGGMEGVMRAACQGAREAGGVTIGVLPTSSKKDANEYVEIPVVTGMGTARNVVIVRTADALIAIDGKFGTLSEIAHALDQGKKVVSLKSWPVEKMGIHKDLVIPVGSPEEAVGLAFEIAMGRATLEQQTTSSKRSRGRTRD